MASELKREDPTPSRETLEPSGHEKFKLEASDEVVPTVDHQEDPDTDAVLATAPWQYKLIALVTALMLPSKTIYHSHSDIIHIFNNLQLNHSWLPLFAKCHIGHEVNDQNSKFQKGL